MKMDNLLDLVGGVDFFDLATIAQLSGEDRTLLRTQLYRWTRAGKVISLRRGMYALALRYQQRALNPAAIANALYTPSYLSEVWALGYYGLIPERIFVYTSVTSRAPRKFANPLGNFEYRHVKQDLFFGYAVTDLGGKRVLLAEPEKALLDLWYLSSGAWTRERMAEMRFQEQQLVDQKRLERYARKFASPRLQNAVAVWIEDARSQLEGTVEV